ncbi:MAG: hypothetical protein ACKVW3_08420 [Phycisphaerales bacterium]
MTDPFSRHASIAARLRDEADSGLHAPARSITGDVMSAITSRPLLQPVCTPRALQFSLTTLAAAAAVALVAWLGGLRVVLPTPAPREVAITTIAARDIPVRRVAWMGGVFIAQPAYRASPWTAFDTGLSVASALQHVADLDNPLADEAELIVQDATEATRRVLAALPVAWR